MRGLLGRPLLLFRSWYTCSFVFGSPGWALLQFTHGIRPFCARLVRMAVVLVSLMVCSPLMRGSSRQPLLQFRSLCSPPFVRGPLVWPLLRSLMVDLPPFMHGSLGWPLSSFTHIIHPFHVRLAWMAVAPFSLMACLPLSCTAHWDGCCPCLAHACCCLGFSIRRWPE